MDFKIRCTCAMEGGNFTEGKTYRVEDGILFDDEDLTHYGSDSIQKINGRMTSQFELVEDETLNSFKISDIKPCMLVELRKGTICMVMETEDSSNKNGLILTSKQGDNIQISKNYNNELKEAYFNDENYDIMKVWGFTNISYQVLDFVKSGRKLLYERKEKVKMSLKEIEERMGV